MLMAWCEQWNVRRQVVARLVVLEDYAGSILALLVEPAVRWHISQHDRDRIAADYIFCVERVAHTQSSSFAHCVSSSLGEICFCPYFNNSLRNRKVDKFVLEFVSYEI